MRPARVAAATLIVLAGLVLLLAGATWAVSRTDWAAAQVAARASATLGQPVRLAGLAVGLFPAPSVALEGLEVGPDGAAGPLLSAGRGILVLRWSDLRRAPTVLHRLRLEGLTLRLAVDAAGADNWTALVERVIELAGTGPAAFAIDDLAIEDGRVEYADAGEGGLRVLTSLALEASDVEPARPFPLRLRLAGEANGYTFHNATEAEVTLDPDQSRYLLEAASLRGWIGGGAFGVGGADAAGSIDRLDVDLGAQVALVEGLAFDALGLRGRASARVTSLLAAPAAEFTAETQPFAPRAVANALGQPLPGTTDPAALGQAEVALDGRFGAAGLVLDRFAGRLDDTRFSGSLQVPPAPARPTLQLALDAIDLDRYLPPGSDEPASPGAALGELLGSVDALAFGAVVEVGRASVAGTVARGLRVTVEPSDAGAGNP